MAEDKLLRYQDLINELKLQLGDQNFEKIFRQTTSHLSKPDQFLLKMEMSRLSQPVSRFIDLRGQVAGEVRPYEYEGKQHFMDDVAIAVFEEEVARHGGYTLAVYEAVMHTENNYRVMQREAQLRELSGEQTPEQNPHYVKAVRFASYESRIEERMNYSIKISVDLPKGRTVSATTSDISLSGAKIKLAPKHHVNKGDLLSIRLVGLEQEFELGLKSGIQYEVVAVETVSREYNHVRLKRTFIEKNQSFDDFLNSFIHGNKRRYKINLDNTMDAIVCKSYEQYYLPRVASLFTFISKKDNFLIPNIALYNENSAFIHRYFCDERKVSCLYSILNQRRLKALMDKHSSVKETILYTFTHSVGGKLYYYSATEAELLQMPKLRSLFFGFGSKKDSWMSFKLQLMPSTREDAFIPLSLPESLGKSLEKLNKPPTPRVQGLIHDVQFLLVITEISTPAITAKYQQQSYSQEQLNQLKQFGHGKAANPPYLEAVALEYVNLRAHRRYLYKTAVELHLEGHVSVNAYSRDFSVMGMQIEAERPLELKKGDIVYISLPELQKITKQHNLSHLCYEVMAVSKSQTTINLRVSNPTDSSKGVAIQFFTQLIENNKSKLQACDESPKIPGLSTALRNMVTKSVCQFPLYFHKAGQNLKIGAVGVGLYKTSLHRILGHFTQSSGDLISIEQLLPTGFIDSALTEALRAHTRQDKPLQYTLFIKFDPSKTSAQEALKSQCVALDEPLEPLYLFAKKALKGELLFVYRLYVSKTGRPDIDYLANEMRYVSHYAIHKAKELEETLWAVAGVGDVIDISEEVIGYFDFETSLVEGMHARKLAWLEGHLR
ncbi:PilZ domain-containing protein [Pseudoalteromonas fenneropenaei]|uniref:PilZ domain-containing protein n=1 Tax=Pseudoalteromonas fenneropenaei TaxID=1737459 RepID=A0ABV7CH82_9GAMM